MESVEKKEEMIDKKYIIQKKIASNKSSTVFLVKKKGEDIPYIAKVIKEIKDKYLGYFQREIDVLNLLKKHNVPNTIRIIEDGEGEVYRKGILYKSRRYFILEYAENRDLEHYIYHNKGGFGEDFGKIIFYKIVETIEAIHNLGICHRDIKLENILFADEFILKVCDFGFSIKNKSDLKEYIGTENYAAPEIFYHIPYNGFKNDIFCLGATLFFLVTGKKGFHETDEYFELYELYIQNKNIDEEFNKCFDDFWTTEVDPDSQLSVEFKKLYKKMISFNPKDRPDFKTIKSNSWFNDMNNKNLNDKLETELKERLNIINTNNTLKLESNEVEFIKSKDGRATNDHKNTYFKEDIKPKMADEKMNMDYCIIIKGYLNVDGNIFMDILCETINDKYGENNCEIEPSKFNLKINVTFEENNIRNNDINNDLIKGMDNAIQIKLYKKEDRLFILKFKKIEGTKKQFMDNFKTISELVKQILKKDLE
jgi:serine/threonine protein kinase